jgi:hypothetical protein
MCNSCCARKLERKRQEHEGKLTNSILDCKTYGILWQRDVNVSKNMLDIANPIFESKGRLEAFTRKITVEETYSLSEIYIFTL